MSKAEEDYTIDSQSDPWCWLGGDVCLNSRLSARVMEGIECVTESMILHNVTVLQCTVTCKHIGVIMISVVLYI